MARLIPEKLRGKPGSALHHFRKVLKRLPDDFTAWFSIAADEIERPQVFLVWRERHAFLIQIAETSQQLAEAAVSGDLFSNDLIIHPEDLGREESGVLEKFIASASDEFGPLTGALPVRKLVVFPNVHQHTIDEVIINRKEEDDISYLGLHQLDDKRFAHHLEALAVAALPDPSLFHLRGLFTPESIIPSDFDARRSIDRNTRAKLGGGFLDFDQEWCVKNDLDLLPEQQELVDESSASARTRLVTGVAGSGKSLVLLYRALLSARLHPKAKVLILTHNRPLRFELERRSMHLAKIPANLDCFTFFEWAAKCVDFRGETLHYPSDIERTLKNLRTDFPSLEKLSTSFLADEIGWIKDNKLLPKDTYLNADRLGRGTRLTADQREKLWEIFRAYQNKLVELGVTDWHNIALRFHETAVVEQRLKRHYDAIFVDEAQFFAKSWFEIVRAALTPGGHLFLAADPTQGFLRRRQSWIAAGVNVRGRTTRLSHAYRNTRAILTFARDFYQARRNSEEAEMDLRFYG
ncbi:MAG: UvrD-helicase domain-containing protein [Luteolibacter sp.]